MAVAAYINDNTTNGITGVPTTVDETPELFIYEEIISEVEPDPLGD